MRIIVTGLAISLGLIAAAFFMTIGFAIYGLRRLFGRPAKMPVFRHTTYQTRTPPRSPRNPLNDEGVIDVVATQVKE